MESAAACCMLLACPGLVDTVESACKHSGWGWTAAGTGALGSGVAPNARRKHRHVHALALSGRRACAWCV